MACFGTERGAGGGEERTMILIISIKTFFVIKRCAFKLFSIFERSMRASKCVYCPQMKNNFHLIPTFTHSLCLFSMSLFSCRIKIEAKRSQNSYLFSSHMTHNSMLLSCIWKYLPTCVIVPYFSIFLPRICKRLGSITTHEFREQCCININITNGNSVK